MIIGDRDAAAQCLARIGYYRLKSYWIPFREIIEELQDGDSVPVGRSESFRPGTRFSYGVDLYIFDKKLRLHLLDALERIEVAIRVALAHTVGLRSTWAHHLIEHLDPNRARNQVGGRSAAYDKWLKRANYAEDNSKAGWVTEYKLTYSSPLPLWMAVELWDFGLLSRFLALARAPDRMTIARKFFAPNPAVLESWIRSLAHVRNLCAHHSRVWNNRMTSSPSISKSHGLPRLDHVATSVAMQSRIYGAAAVAQHFLDVINPNSRWKHRLRALWDQFPNIPGVSPEQAGFVAGWEKYPIWNFDDDRPAAPRP
ncbi:MAG: Abi family protein [Allosphingosinicella sp.]